MLSQLTSIKSDPLDVLLFGVGLRLSQLAKSDNEKFKSLLQNRNFTIQLGSEAEGVARYFSVNDGKFSQQAGNATDPTLTITFKDSMTGAKLLTKGDATAFMTGIQKGDLKMSGDYSLLMWFNQVSKFIVPKVPEPLQPVVEQAKPLLEKAMPIAQDLFTKVTSFLGGDSDTKSSKYFNESNTADSKTDIKDVTPKSKQAVDLDETKSDKLEGIKDKAGELLETAKEKLAEVKETVSEKVDDVKAQAEEKLDAGKEKLAEVKTQATEKLADVKTTVSEKVETVKTDAETKLEEAKDKVADVKTQTAEKLTDVKETVAEKADDLKAEAQDKLEVVKDKVTEVKTQATEKLADAKEAVSEKADDVKNEAKPSLDALKGEALSKVNQGTADTTDKTQEDELTPAVKKSLELEEKHANEEVIAENLKTDAVKDKQSPVTSVTVTRVEDKEASKPQLSVQDKNGNEFKTKS